MLLRFDPFRELDRLTDGLMGGRLSPVPMDAYRRGEEFVVHFDLPGVDQSSIELTVEDNVLTVSAERSWSLQEGEELVAAERPQGRFSRRLILGESLDTDRIEATYTDGVLTLRIPVAESAKPRKIAISGARTKALGGSEAA